MLDEDNFHVRRSHPSRFKVAKIGQTTRPEEGEDNFVIWLWHVTRFVEVLPDMHQFPRTFSNKPPATLAVNVLLIERFYTGKFFQEQCTQKSEFRLLEQFSNICISSDLLRKERTWLFWWVYHRKVKITREQNETASFSLHIQQQQALIFDTL